MQEGRRRAHPQFFVLPSLRTQALLRKNCHVVILGRSTAKGDIALDQLKNLGGVHRCGFGGSTVQSVRRGAEELASKSIPPTFSSSACPVLTSFFHFHRVEHLDILFNSAGVMAPPPDALTATHRVDLQVSRARSSPPPFVSSSLTSSFPRSLSLDATSSVTTISPPSSSLSSSLHPTKPRAFRES